MTGRDPHVPLRLGAGGIVNQDHVLLNLTRRCNQRCLFCFEEARPWGEPDGEEVRRILREARQVSDEGVIMGGEGLLRKDILEILAYARSIGLRVVAFTNGRVLARRGFLDDLVSAGLEGVVVSANYPDAASFERGTRTPGTRFAEFLEALDQIRCLLDAQGSERFFAGFETVYTRLVQGRLMQVVEILETRLGPHIAFLAIKGLQPPTASVGELLAPRFEVARTELPAVATYADGRFVMRFSRVPLCLLGDHMHLAHEVSHLAGRTVLFSNFADKRTVSTEPEGLDFFRRSPFRWLCADCALRAACPHGFADWHSDMAPPVPETRPFPVTKPTLVELVARVAPGSESDDELLGRRDEQFARVPIPERLLLDHLRSLRQDGSPVHELLVRRHPILSARWMTPSGERWLDVGFARPDEPAEGEDSYVVGALVVRATRGASGPNEDLVPWLRRLAEMPLARADYWRPRADEFGLDTDVLDAAELLWVRFGERLWPGTGRFGTWATRRSRFLDDMGLWLELTDAEDRRATSVLYGGAFAVPGGTPAGVRAYTSDELAAELFLEDDPPNDVLMAHRAVGALADDLCTLAETPQAASEDHTSRPSAHLYAGPPRLRVRFAEGTGAPPRRWDFLIERRDPVRLAMDVVGEIAISHEPCPTGGRFEKLRGLLGQAARAVGAAPAPENIADWRRQVLGRLRRSPMAADVTVAFRAEGMDQP